MVKKMQGQNPTIKQEQSYVCFRGLQTQRDMYLKYKIRQQAVRAVLFEQELSREEQQHMRFLKNTTATSSISTMMDKNIAMAYQRIIHDKYHCQAYANQIAVDDAREATLDA